MAHRSVYLAFGTFSSPIEGAFRWMYLDKKRLVTTAIGYLINTLEMALALPWRLPSGELASKAQVESEWKAIQLRPELADYRASSHVVESATTVRLLDSDVAAIVQARLLAIEARMRHFFAGWSDFPADAQLGLLSQGWALGSDFELGYPKLTHAANAGDWEACARECAISTQDNPGIIARNAQNVLLFHNAHAVSELHLDPETLYWPARAPTVDPSIHYDAAQAMCLAPFPATPVAFSSTIEAT